jgi:hypothetical protein
MHPVPVGETGEARSKGGGGEGDHPACTTTGRKVGDTPPPGNAFTLAPRQGQRPLAIHHNNDRRGRAPRPRRDNARKKRALDQQAGGVGPIGRDDGAGSAERISQSAAAVWPAGAVPGPQRGGGRSSHGVTPPNGWDPAVFGGPTNGGPRARDRHRKAETPAQQGRGLGPRVRG